MYAQEACNTVQKCLGGCRGRELFFFRFSIFENLAENREGKRMEENGTKNRKKIDHAASHDGRSLDRWNQLAEIRRFPGSLMFQAHLEGARPADYVVGGRVALQFLTFNWRSCTLVQNEPHIIIIIITQLYIYA